MQPSDHPPPPTMAAAASPPLPFRTRVVIGAIATVTNASILRDGTVNRRLMTFLDRPAPPNPTPLAGVATSDHTVDPSRNLWFRLFSPTPPPSSTPLPAIVFFHGGGFAFHSASSRPFDGLCRRLASRTPATVLSVEYRRSPEHRHPAPYDDGIDVLRWLDGDEGRRLIPELPAVFLAGDSAGGNIAHHVARRTAAKNPMSRAAVAGLVAIQPFFGGEVAAESEVRFEAMPFGNQERIRWMWRSFLPEGSDRDHEAANVFGPGSRVRSGREEWAGFPATVVVVGGWDGLQDRQRWYAEGLRGAGVDVRVAEYPNAIHGFSLFPELMEADQILTDVGDFVRQQMER